MQGTPKAIQIQGIVRNATVIGAQDGQAEDLINLRFMDGSWRASGDGRLINFTMGAEYTQLYVHTNVYHHLLGVNNGTLYWFAEIGTDGTTFYPLNNTTSRTNWPQDMQSLPTSPVALTTVVGDIWITQTGHLLTIIDENDDFEFWVYKIAEKAYMTANLDVNGKDTDRTLFPFGYIHFNLHEPFEQPVTDFNIKSHSYAITGGGHVHSTRRNNIITAFNKVQEKNLFTRPFLICAAIRLYDGKFAYATNPVLLHPRETALRRYYDANQDKYIDISSDRKVIKVFGTYNSGPYFNTGYSCYYPEYDTFDQGEKINPGRLYTVEADPESRLLYYHADTKEGTISGEPVGYVPESWFPVITEINIDKGGTNTNIGFMILGSDIVCSIDKIYIDAIVNNPDLFQSLCIFITPEIDEYNLSTEYEDKDSSEYVIDHFPLFDMSRPHEDIVYDLVHSGFFLLREYKKENIVELFENPIVDLSGKENEFVLKNIVQRERLTTEAFARTTYLPKVSYMYNGRLHIANYKSYPFFGYPIDLFHLHNHSVKVQANSWFKGVLPNLADNNDDYLQYAKTDYNFVSNPPIGLDNFAYIRVIIDSEQGEQKVVRYIPPYDLTTAVNGRADFIESLNPLLTYPDARAKTMEIRIFKGETTDSEGVVFQIYYETVQLKPHPYLNMAYYIAPDLKPIKLATYSSPSLSMLKAPTMQNTEEYFPNGLKVSKTDNPMFFPVENTYQVGSAEILALMSNTIAVGTGQTGAAPLYVFCKDGVYALFVDASGQMTYSNSRVLARDVCNNPRSVTPIDAGVVFTTDRGLMMIAGEQVEEIGQPAEGDVLHYTNVNAQGQPLSVEGSKIATDALTKIAGLPSSLCDTTDFLTYLQDKGTSGKAAIINYNHNMRELIISNPNYAYSYVLDREGNWSRRDYTAAEYVNNYPTSYRVAVETVNNQQVRRFYKLDDEGDASTSLEHRKEADNQIFYLSNVIKLDSIGFKQAYRFVVRGYFETATNHENMLLGTFSIPHNLYTAEQYTAEHYDALAYLDDAIKSNLSVGDTVLIKKVDTNYTLTTQITDNGAYLGLANGIRSGDGAGYGDYEIYKVGGTAVATNVGIVVEGSYDGIKFAPLGFNRKTGKFTDIGCNVSHTDMRFYRVILCGQVTGKTRINYMELSAVGSKLNTKIR